MNLLKFYISKVKRYLVQIFIISISKFVCQINPVLFHMCLNMDCQEYPVCHSIHNFCPISLIGTVSPFQRLKHPFRNW